MSRIRTIKPDFFIDEDVAKLKPLTRILFTGLWCLADKAGRLEDRPQRIKIQILPYDNIDIDAALNDLSNASFIIRYTTEGQKLIQIRSFNKHQRPHHTEKESDLPPCNGEITVKKPLSDGDNPAGKEGKGKERKGKEGNKEYTSEKKQFLDVVFLSENEHETLIAKYGRDPTERAIEILNNAIMSKGYKYKSHYHTIIGWPMKEASGNGSKRPIEPKTYAQAKDAEKRALFATYNAQKEGSHGNAENNPDGDNKIAGRLPLPGPVS